MRLRHRITLLLVGAAVGGALVAAAATRAWVGTAVREQLVERVRGETALLAEWIARESADDPQALAMRAAAPLGVRVTLIAADGVPLGDSALDPSAVAAMGLHTDRPEIDAARLSGVGESFRRSATTNETYFYCARVVRGAGRVGFVRVALPASEIERAQRTPAAVVFVVALLALLLLTAPAVAAVGRVARRLERTAAAVERGAASDAPLELPHGGGLEFERLGVALRGLQSALRRRLDACGAEQDLFHSVIAGMREGLLVVGSDRRIRLVNEAFVGALELEFDPRGHLLEEAVRHPDVLRDIRLALQHRRESSAASIRLPGSGRSFQLQVTPLGAAAADRAEAALALLFDITELERLEAVRREFVANVSHELRTPLTSILASVETLLDDANVEPGDARRFLEIVRKHAQRMSDLIEDLTDLSLIETGAVSLDVAVLDAAEVVRGVVEHLAPLAAGRRVAIQLELPSPLPLAADRRRLEQVLTNLIDNAVKFNRAGGRVVIRGRREGALTTLSVVDTGIGIPADSLEKIFHRFHQVSRDRSRELRGTGLGLAIVKHLMRLHGGSVRVDSELGAGSTFTLEFPAAA